MDFNNMGISAKDLSESNLEPVIEGLQPKDYRSAFDKAARDCDEPDRENIYCLMSAITSMRLNAEDTRNPYSAMFISADSRSTVPEDLDTSCVEELAKFCMTLSNPSLRALIADIAWIRLRKPDLAVIAVDSYIESAKILEDPHHWTESVSRITRALKLASFFKRKDSSTFDNVVAHIKLTVDKYKGQDPFFLSIKLLSLLLEYSNEDAEKYYDLCISIAERESTKNNWHKAESAWEASGEWAIALKDEGKKHFALKMLAETYVKQAESFVQGLGSSHWMQKAIEVYKKIPDSRERRDELYKLLRCYQKAAVDEMSLIEGPKTDISELVNNSRDAVKNHSFEEALFHLSFSVLTVPDYDGLKEQAEKDSKEFFLQSFIGAVHFDRGGLKVAQVPPVSGMSDDESGKATWASILRSVQTLHNLNVQGCIEPAREEILFEHNPVDSSFLGYLKNNPFVRPGSEWIYAKGLNAGFHRDFVSAAHLLIPQLENSFRYVLEQRGVETTTLNTHGLQEHIRIGAILNHPVFEAAFGKSISLDLQGLLIDRKYANLRNEVSHGLLPADHFFTAPVIYLWWLSLRLCLTPFFTAWNDRVKEEALEEVEVQ